MVNFDERIGKPEQSKIPTSAELKAALPEELRDEFQELGEKLEKISLGAFYEVAGETPSEEEKKMFARYDELTVIAQENLKKKEN